MATAKKTPAPAAAPDGHKFLQVVAKRPGFRRAGRVFGDQAEYIPLDELSQEDFDAIRSEPMLVSMTVAERPAAAD